MGMYGIPPVRAAVGCVIVLLAFLSQACASPSGTVLAGFSDVTSSHPYAAAITDLHERGVVSGYSDGRFGPDDSVTRQQFAKMVVLSMGFAVGHEDTCEFLDVESDASSLYPYHYVAVAANNGLMLGYGLFAFGPHDRITRAQVVTAIVRASGRGAQDIPEGWQGVLRYSDSWHGESIRLAEYSGLLAGIQDLPHWNASSYATRGEVAQMLHNLVVGRDHPPPLSVMNYGAVGDGIADESRAIQRTIDARAGGGEVFIPAGIYRVSKELQLRSGVTIRGAGAQSTVIVMADRQDQTFVFSGTNLRDVSILELTIRASGYTANVSGVYMPGAHGCTARSLRLEGLFYGLKLGSGDEGSRWVVEDVVARDCRSPLYVSCVSDSSFSGLDLEAVQSDVRNHVVYIEREARNLTFSSSRFSGGAGYCLHLYAEGGSSSGISFASVTLDSNRGGRPLYIGGRFSDIAFSQLVIAGSSDGEAACILWGSPSDVTIDGIDASGGAQLQAAEGGTPHSCAIRNGTYKGTQIGTVAGVSVTNVTLTN